MLGIAHRYLALEVGQTNGLTWNELRSPRVIFQLILEFLYKRFETSRQQRTFLCGNPRWNGGICQILLSSGLKRLAKKGTCYHRFTLFNQNIIIEC
jgi:hypothetical protein